MFINSTTPTSDVIYEAAGNSADTVDMTNVTSAVTFDLNVQLALRATNLTIELRDGAAGDGSPNMENVRGSLTHANTLIGNVADNTLIGGDVADTITGTTGNNDLFGRAGDDTFLPGAGNDDIYGDAGYDRMDYSPLPGPVIVDLDARLATGVSYFETVELFIGTTSSDTLIGTSAGDAWHITGTDSGDVNAPGIADFVTFENLTGAAADDSFIFSDGATVAGAIDGGAGTDTLDYSAYTTDLTVDLLAGAATGTASVANIENLLGGSGNDALVGDSGNNRIEGNAGTDKLLGLDGNDTLLGGADDDTLDGGLANDRFLLNDDGSTETVVEGPAGGLDLIDYTAFASPVAIDLQNGTATGTSGVAEIELFIGGSSGNDRFIGPDTANGWNVLNADLVILNGAIGALGFEHIVGGSAGAHRRQHRFGHRQHHGWRGQRCD